jgi:hypothetical protein
LYGGGVSLQIEIVNLVELDTTALVVVIAGLVDVITDLVVVIAGLAVVGLVVVITGLVVVELDTCAETDTRTTKSKIAILAIISKNGFDKTVSLNQLTGKMKMKKIFCNIFC